MTDIITPATYISREAQRMNLSATQTTKAGIAEWLKQYISRLTEIDLAEIDPDSTFERYGFDSYQGVVMTFELGAWLGVELDSTDTFDHPSIARLSDFLAADEGIRAAYAKLHG